MMRFLTLVIVAVAIASPSIARAADEVRAKELFANGTTLYQEGDYEAALVAFREAQRQLPAPEFHFNIANCLERLERFDEAIAALNLYRAVAPADEQATLERRIVSLEKGMARRLASTTVTATPAVVAPSGAIGDVSAAASSRRHPRWWLVGLGAGVASVGGAGAGWSFSSAQTHLDEGDRVAYDNARGINSASFATVGVGAGLAVLGLALPVGRRVSVSASPAAGGFRWSLGGAF